MRLIDADALTEELLSWARVITKLNLMATDDALCVIDHAPTIAPRWVRCEEHPPKPGCYLTASPAFYGDDYSWLFRLAWWTEHGLMDFVQDAEKESGWYIWNHDQDRDTEIEPMYWMPIEPPKEGV